MTMPENTLTKAIILDDKMRRVADLDPAKIIEPVTVEDADTGEHTLRFDYPIDAPGGNVRRLTAAPWDGCTLDGVEIDNETGGGSVRLEPGKTEGTITLPTLDAEAAQKVARGWREWVKSENPPLYADGREWVEFVEGYSAGEGSVSKEEDYLLIQASGTGGQRSFVTEHPIDLTGIESIFIEAEQSVTVSGVLYFQIISSVPGGDYNVYETAVVENGAFSRKMITLDVSGLTGDYHIRILSRSPTSTMAVTTKVYRIGLGDGTDTTWLDIEQSLDDDGGDGGGDNGGGGGDGNNWTRQDAPGDMAGIEYGMEPPDGGIRTRARLFSTAEGASPTLESIDETILATSAAAQLEGGNTVIIPDMDGDLLPFVIRESEIIGAGGQVIRRAICAHLFYELGDGPVRAYSLTNATPATAISAALAGGTRWSAGDVDPELLTLTKDFDTDYLNSLEFLRLIEKEFDAQLKFRVEIDGGAGIIGNTISAYLVDLIAPDEIFSGKRFEFGHDLQRIKIVVDHSQVKTALFGHALGEEIDPLTGDPLPLTFEGEEWSRAAGDPADKPLGQDWVGNEEARKLYGIYDPATGERLHRYGKHESEAESAGELLENTWLIGERYHFRPLVSIEGDVADLEGVKIVSVEDEQGPEIAYDRKSMAVHPSTGVEVPSDTPIFLPFAGGKQGLLIEEGVKNLLTANQGSFETSSTVQAATRYTHERSAEWSKHGQYSQKLIRDSNETADAYMWYRCTISGQGFAVGTLFVAQAVLYLPPGCWYIGKDINFRMRFAGGVQATGAFTSQTFTLHEGENLLWVAGELDYSDRQWIEYFIWEVGAGHRAPGETVFYTDCHMGYAGSYLLSWAPGGEPRVGARAYTEPPEPLSSEFGIGLAVKMLHDSEVKDRTFWQAGGYACFYDTAASKIKMTNGVVAAEVGATWDAGDIIAIYTGRCDGKLFIQGKIAGVTTDLVKVTGDALSGVEEITIGSSSGGSGSGHVNGVITDFTYHDDPALVNPAGYFAKITGGGA